METTETEQGVRVISPQEVIEALEGPYDGKRGSCHMYLDGRFCCLGVMGALAGIEPGAMMCGLPYGMEYENYATFKAAFPWLSGDDWRALANVNDEMPSGDRSFSGPVAKLNEWISKGRIS